MVRGKTSPGLKGATTVEDGFRRLLAGSGYGIARAGSDYTLVAQSAAAPAAAPAAAADSTTLPALQVTANGMMPGGLAQPYA
ncbi:STN domain-containing protein, partial [Acinetobacter baumannii]